MGIFLDTGFYFALLSKKDINHKRSQEILIKIGEGIYGRICTSNFVFNESMTLLNVRTRGNRKDLLEKMSVLFLGSEPIAEMIKMENNWLQEIVDLQIKITKGGNPISFTDCSNIIICQKLNLTKIVSFDSHYDGFLTKIY
ncbi:MAG: PIN domain-containing protein [Promethearchaeota archaeon]|nr:MAG: PIN domain-containing protein [Candidatus Lokiarchaeota archaeon]